MKTSAATPAAAATPEAHMLTDPVTLDKTVILADLHDPRIRSGRGMRYEDVAAKHGTSRGTVWSIAVENSARKNEPRIQERVAETKRRRQETVRQLVNAVQTADVLDFFDGL